MVGKTKDPTKAQRRVDRVMIITGFVYLALCFTWMGICLAQGVFSQVAVAAAAGVYVGFSLYGWIDTSLRNRTQRDDP